MTTNLHDKMLAAIDAYFSASDGTEEEVAENLLLDVRDEINKQKYVPETNFGNMAEPKIGCVNHDCDKCKAVQEPVAYLVTGPYEKRPFTDLNSANAYCSGLNKGWGERVYTVSSLYTAPQPVPVKTYHDGKPWPVAPKPWVGLTDEERHDIREWEEVQKELGPVWAPMMLYLYLAIEAKLREKNGGAA
jgi:hypothetical protein